LRPIASQLETGGKACDAETAESIPASRIA
jgi:hypothetical protein